MRPVSNCKKCNVEVSRTIYAISMKKFKVPLCVECQKDSSVVKADGLENSKDLRVNGKFKKSTALQRKLYEELIKRGIEAKLELWDGHKHIDIALPALKLNIEVDGFAHSNSSKQALTDIQRVYFSYKRGYFTLRIPNIVLEERFEEALENILRFCE